MRPKTERSSRAGSGSNPDLIAAARRVSRLLRAGVTPMPSTDIRAEALEACATLDELCDREER